MNIDKIYALRLASKSSGDISGGALCLSTLNRDNAKQQTIYCLEDSKKLKTLNHFSSTISLFQAFHLNKLIVNLFKHP